METCWPETVILLPFNPVSVGQLPIAAGITGSEPVVVTGPVPFDPPSAEPPLDFPPELEVERPPDDPELVLLLPSESSPFPSLRWSPDPLELPPDALPDPLELLEVPVPLPESGPKSEVLVPVAHAAT
jgi:hypothetical protein